MMSTDSDDPELDKLLAELEKEGEEPKPIINKQIQKAKDENREKEVHEWTDADNYDGPTDEETEENIFD